MPCATCGPFCPVRSVDLFEPSRDAEFLALRACTCAFERGTARLYAYGRRRTELPSSSELLGRINAPPAPGLSGRRLTPPPSAADTRLPPRRCAYTTPIRLSGRPKPLKPTRDGPSRGTPPHNSNTTDADASSTGRARCAVCKCPDGRVSLVYGRPGGLRCHRAQWSPRRSGRSLPQRYEIPRASAVWASSHALPPRAAAVQSWA